MPIRILSKEETKHIANAVSILMAFACTSYYFDSHAATPVMAHIGNFLLTPVYIADYFALNFLNISIAGNRMWMFIVLWMSYFPFALKLAVFLIIKDYGVAELKHWYYGKNQTN